MPFAVSSPFICTIGRTTASASLPPPPRSPHPKKKKKLTTNETLYFRYQQRRKPLNTHIFLPRKRHPCCRQGAFLNLGSSIGLFLLDTAWARVTWDGRIGDVEGGDGGPDRDETRPGCSQLVSPGAWKMLDLELGRDSELRLLVVAVRVSSLLPRLEPVASSCG